MQKYDFWAVNILRIAVVGCLHMTVVGKSQIESFPQISNELR